MGFLLCGPISVWFLLYGSHISFLFLLRNPAHARVILSFRFVQVPCNGLDRAGYIKWTKFHCASDVGLNNPRVPGQLIRCMPFFFVLNANMTTLTRVAHSLHAFAFSYLRCMLLSF
jgi:hypothetical protein